MSLNSWVLDTSSNCGNGTVIRNVETNEEYTYDFASSPVSGIPHPNFIKEENVKALREQLVFRDSDVFVCTYSKSGTTLMEQIVLLLQNNGDATKLNPLHKNTYDRTTKAGKIWCEMSVFPDGISGSNPEAKKACMGENKSLMTVQEFDSLSNRLIKTHAPKDLFLGLKDVEHENKVIKTTSLEFVQGIKIIYVSRNPFDACVSCYYHPKPGVSPESNGCPFPAFAKLWLSERIEFGGWSNHISGWRQLYHSDMNYSMSNKSIPQILWISYEELVTHTKSSISKVAAFLEIDASSTLIENVMEGCKFESVKRSAEILMKDGMDGNLNHLRKGKVGDWRNHFTPELKEEFGQQLKENIPNGLDVIFDIGDGMKWNIESVDSTSESVSYEKARMIDIKIIGGTVIFYSILQMVLSYANEFYADEQRAKSGLPNLVDFPIITVVLANVFNGISGGMALMTTFCAWKLITSHLGNVQERYTKWIYYFMVSIVFESLITSGVMHSIGHRIFGSTFEGNAWVEVIFHLGYTANVILTAIFMIFWVERKYLPFICPKWYEVLVSLCVAGLAITFTLYWKPFLPNPTDFDYPDGTDFDENLINLLQGKIQPLIEAAFLIPTVLILFTLQRLWITVTHNSQKKYISHLESTTLRISMLASIVPLFLNWIHFRCHDDLVGMIQTAMHWDHMMLISAIRILFHIPNWILAIGRLHFLRRLAEEKGCWPVLKIYEVLFPGGNCFPFMMIFLYRASEGMTLSLLPAFFQDGLDDNKFHLDITGNTWVAITILAMFAGNAIGAVALGNFMQRYGFNKSFILVTSSFDILMSLFMVPHHNSTLLLLRCVAAIIFPGPVMLSCITQLTRQKYTGALKYVPMTTALIWFNQGFWFGGAISNSSAWTKSWNVFFTSGLILSILATFLIIAFLFKFRQEKKKLTLTLTLTEEKHDRLHPNTQDSVTKEINDEEKQSHAEETCTRVKSFSTNDINKVNLRREKWASFVNGISFSTHVSLLGIQITRLVDIDLYEYTTIVGSLGSMSTILILITFGFMTRQRSVTSLLFANVGHIIGTGILSIPSIYALKSQNLAVAIIAMSYAIISISFFIMNLSCEVSLGQKSLKNAELSGGKEMGKIKSWLSAGKVVGSINVVTFFRVDPQLPLWIVECFMIISLVALSLNIKKLERNFRILLGLENVRSLCCLFILFCVVLSLVVYTLLTR